MAAEQPPDVEAVLTLLRVHDCSAREAAFAVTLHRCAICFDDHPGANGIKPPCGHWHCKECMKEMAVTLMNASDPSAIRCPKPECRVQLDPVTLQELLDAEQIALWDSLMLNRALARMSDVVFCPRCETAAVEHSEWAMCTKCNYAFCSLCYGAYHPGVQCATAEEKLRLLDERCTRHGTAKVRDSLPHPLYSHRTAVRVSIVFTLLGEYIQTSAFLKAAVNVLHKMRLLITDESGRASTA